MNAFVMAGITLNTVTYRQIRTLGIDPQVEEAINNGGQVDPVFAALMRQRPMTRFTSNNIGLFLGVCGIGGLAIDATFDAYFAALVHGGTRSYTDCFKATANDGLVMLRSLRASHGSEAECEYEVHATYDGTNEPLKFATGATCPADSAGVTKYTLGPLKIGSTLIEVQELAFDLGGQVGQYGNNGEAYDRMACIMARRPRIAATTLDLEALDTAGEQGSSAAVTMFLRKMTNKGTRVADATEEHIALVGAASYVRAGAIEGSEGQEATGRIEIQLVYNGSDAILVPDTTAAIA